MGNTCKNENSTSKIVQRKIEIDIVCGKYRTGEKVPSTRELVEMYNIGTSTSQKILNEMSADGILNNFHGKGYFVNEGAKEILQKTLMKELITGFNSYVDFACELNLDKNLIQNIINEIYSKK